MKQNKTILSITLYIFIFTAALQGQAVLPGTPTTAQVTDPQLLLAISNEEYPVTPGDVYGLTFLTAGELISHDILVESDYSLNLNVLGKIDAAGKTFRQIKPLIENTFSKYYPESMPSLTILALGRFLVTVKGEIPETRYISGWGLSRLSEIVTDTLGNYSSTREVGVLSAKNVLKKFDLFRSRVFGETENDPYIKPGDTIIIYRRGKEVEIKGEVYNPGHFQLTDPDLLDDLIKIYARGYTPKADQKRIKIERVAGAQIESINFDQEAIESGISLIDGDVIIVPGKEDKKPILYIEGAVASRLPDDLTLPVPEPLAVSYNRIAASFTIGESLFELLQRIKNAIFPYGDLKSAYLERDGIPLTVDVEKLFYIYDSSQDIPLKPFDRLVVPIKISHITVIGSVTAPGNYTFIPGKDYTHYISQAGGFAAGTFEDYTIIVINKNGEEKFITESLLPEDRIIVSRGIVNITGSVMTPGSFSFVKGNHYDFYLNLAGGIDTTRNDSREVEITDVSGTKKAVDQVIEPGDTIFVPSDSFLYNYGNTITIIAASVGLVAAIVGLANDIITFGG